MPYPTGTCRECGAPPATGKSRCDPCLAGRRTRDAALRAERRTARRCLTCAGRVVRGRRYCSAHLAYYREREAEQRREAHRINGGVPTRGGHHE